jgi:hypothetical protein
MKSKEEDDESQLSCETNVRNRQRGMPLNERDRLKSMSGKVQI